MQSFTFVILVFGGVYGFNGIELTAPLLRRYGQDSNTCKRQDQPPGLSSA